MKKINISWLLKQRCSETIVWILRLMKILRVWISKTIRYLLRIKNRERSQLNAITKVSKTNPSFKSRLLLALKCNRSWFRRLRQLKLAYCKTRNLRCRTDHLRMQWLRSVSTFPWKLPLHINLSTRRNRLQRFNMSEYRTLPGQWTQFSSSMPSSIRCDRLIPIDSIRAT